MKLSFEGRIRNITLPYTRALMPLFEAVINSIHAIEDGVSPTGKISIEIIRDTGGSAQYSTLRASGEITGFRITDNGTGFTEANFNSFETSDSTYKQSRGAKGVGRFMWLKAFTSVKVTSVFKNGKSFRRSFAFDLAHDGTHAHSVEECKVEEPSFTRVDLEGFNGRYADECPKRIQTIADRIVEHCLFYFLDPKCPTIEVAPENWTGKIVNDKPENESKPCPRKTDASSVLNLRPKWA